ncbi:MAG: hypothetical protein ACE5H2_09320 [Terriglobia bacterium]
MPTTHQVQSTRYKLPPRLEGAWIEIFKAGDYADRGRWTQRDLDHIAATYNPRLHAAPLVLGHPQHDTPACAWVKALRRAGPSLWAQLEQVDPAFEQLLRAGRFRTRSVALYTHFPPTRGPYLRHIGFLGAQAPEVKALSPVRFCARGASVHTAARRGALGGLESPTLAFAFTSEAPESLSNPVAPLPRAESRGATGSANTLSNPVAPATGSLEDPMPESKSKLESFLDHLRAFFTSEPASPSGSGDPYGSSAPQKDANVLSNPVALLPRAGSRGATGQAFAEPALSEVEGRIVQLEQRLDLLAEQKRATEQKLAEHDTSARHREIESFLETLRARGKFPPVFERLGVRAFLERLAELEPQETSFASSASSASCASSEANEAKEEPVPGSLLTWFQEFLTRLPAVIDFRELAADTSHAPRATAHEKLVRFTEPQRGMAIDPASVELAERAQALAAELGISYADALARSREEHRVAHSTA